MKIFLAFLSWISFTSASATSIQLASCAVDREIMLNSQKVIWIEVVGGKYLDANALTVDYAAINFYGTGFKLLKSVHKHNYVAHLQYNDSGYVNKVTIKEAGDQHIIFRVTPETVVSHLPFFETGDKPESANCD